MSEPSVGEESPVVTWRAIAVGAATIAATFYYIVEVGQRLHVGSYVHSQYPMAAFMPFVLWLFLNLALKRCWPSRALTRGELLTLFSMLWVVGTIPQLGWMSYWTSIVAAPSYFATPENQWAETFFAYLPWQVFAPTSPDVIHPFWFGLPEGMALPWDAWVGVIGRWLGVSLGMVVFGLCLMVVFRKQWVEGEKLPFPLAQLPLDLTRGFDGPGRMPEIFRSWVFWAGFGAVFLPILYNICTYFAPGLPEITLYWESYELELGRDLPSLSIRVLPLVLAVAYLCPLDILGSLVLFHLLAQVKRAAMTRVGFSLGGFSVGTGSGASEVSNIIYMESYGALVFVGLWSVWLARRHLREVWRQARSGESLRYRLALSGMALSAAWVVGWAMSLGMGPPVALGSFALMALSYFVVAKLVAATGFAYLFPNREHVKGESFVIELVGSSYLSERSLVAYKVLASHAFFGNMRVPAWPALAHIVRIFPLRDQAGKVVTAVLVAFSVGFVVAAAATIALAYDEGGSVFLGGKANWVFEDMTYMLNNRVEPVLEKWGVWGFGFLEAGSIAYLRGRFYWFPFHPVGLAFQATFGTRLYWFSLFLVWAVKLALLHFGGMRAYQAGRPFFYGMGIGYVVGVTLSTVVDLFWFPTAGHHVHGW